MLTLNDGRKELYQWDTGRTATVDIECDVVHFSNLKYGESLDVEVKAGVVSIPNKLLMIGEPIYCWAFVADATGNYTKQEQTLNVNKRAKPSDYVYTETETLTWKSLDERITELEKGGTGGSGDMQKSVYDPNNKAKDIFKYVEDISKLDVTNHALSDTAHTDIRELITGLTNRLNVLADSDDTTLDQLSEIVAYIKSNKSLIDAITTSKISVSDIIDNLTTNNANKPLSAAQGVALKALIDGITIPEKLPNPNALTFTGAVAGSYDGTEPLTVNIPSSGGGSGGGEAEFPNWRLIKTISISFSADIAYVEFDTDDDGNTFSLKEIMLAGSVPEYSGYIYMKPKPSGFQNTIWPTPAKDLRWWAASVSGKLKTMLAVSNASAIWPVDKDPVCENDTISRLVIGASGGFTADGTMYVYGR